MKRISQLLLPLWVMAVAVFTLPAAGQQEGEDIRNGSLRVFLECAARGCESSHFRTEITYVNWVRDVQDAQLHIIMTSQSTGSGDQFLLDFIGREDLEGTDDQLTYSHSDTDSDDARIQGLTGVLAVGVARYALLAGHESPFTVGTRRLASERPEMPPGLQGEVVDPWNYWVFSVGGDVRIEREDSKKENRYNGNFSANRTTEMWKISITGRGTYTDKDLETSGGWGEYDSKSGSADARLYYTLAERWSVGLDGGVGTSTRDNKDFSGQFGSGVEYSFFPYRDWTRRKMTVQGLVYARYADYEKMTQFNKMSETVWEGSLRWGLGFRQPWGTANLNATAEAFLHDPTSLYRLSFGGRLSYRIARGLEWNVGGSISKIRDQIFLPLEDLSDDDILLGRRQLPTDSRWEVSTGFSFRFGSIYNNIVNNRFSPISMGGRGMMDFFR